MMRRRREKNFIPQSFDILFVAHAKVEGSQISKDALMRRRR
jgi:hypothetical protein